MTLLQPLQDLYSRDTCTVCSNLLTGPAATKQTCLPSVRVPTAMHSPRYLVGYQGVGLVVAMHSRVDQECIFREVSAVFQSREKEDDKDHPAHE